MKKNNNMETKQEFQITVTQERGLAERWFETKEGECWYLPKEYEWSYDAHIDVNVPCVHNEDKNLPQLQELIGSGFLTEKRCYEEFNVNTYSYPEEIDVCGIVNEFKRHGYDVTAEAVEHNFEAWKEDYKSGYRDEKNGYHLFTPIGRNPLSFRLTTLHPLCKEWQTTYQV